jgi:hypothetical protein
LQDFLQNLAIKCTCPADECWLNNSTLEMYIFLTASELFWICIETTTKRNTQDKVEYILSVMWFKSGTVCWVKSSISRNIWPPLVPLLWYYCLQCKNYGSYILVICENLKCSDAQKRWVLWIKVP